MNINEMTAQDCADWLAEHDGYEEEATEPDGDLYWVLRDAAGNVLMMGDHPYKLTLDAAAAALREPWAWDSIEWYTAHVEAVVRSVISSNRIGMTAPDELTARYRAVVAARMEDGK